MKHNEMKRKTQHAKSIKDVYPENYHLNFNTNTHRMRSSIGPTCESGKGRAIERNSTPNIFLVQNKGKGPPGRQRSPVEDEPTRFLKPVRFVLPNAINSDPHSLTSNFGLRSFHPNDFETITDKKMMIINFTNSIFSTFKFNYYEKTIIYPDFGGFRQCDRSFWTTNN